MEVETEQEQKETESVNQGETECVTLEPGTKRGDMQQDT